MKIKFVPQNVEIEIKSNESVLHAAQSNGIHIQSICKGVPSCTECRVRILDGEFNVFPPNQKEITLIGNSYFVDQRRLSCQLKCFGDITIDLTEQVEKAEQASQSKRPRGARTEFDASTSQAKHGNIIFESGAAPGDPQAGVAPVEIDVPADERMVKYESNLKRAEKDLFEEETKRQLAELKGKPEGHQTQRPSREGGRPEQGNRGQGQSQNREQNRDQRQGQNRDQNRGPNRNSNRDSSHGNVQNKGNGQNQAQGQKQAQGQRQARPPRGSDQK